MIMRTAHDHLGEGLLHRHLNSFDDHFNIRHDGRNWKTDDPKVISRQPSSTPFVSDDTRLFPMLAAVYLNNQSHGKANKVCEIGT